MALPPLLAGPILRRCEPDRVLAWLATSTPFRFGMEVREVVPSRGGASLGGASLSPRTESLSVQLGQNLYVHIVGAFPTDGVSLGRRMTEREAGRSAGFPTDTLLAYDIYDQDSPRRLADLIDLAAVSLRPLRWPTFVLASRQSGYRSLYASCRKLHGDGDDAMLAAERVLARDAADPGRRIAALLLGGDQIYADDVSDLITPTVSELATAVTGREEQLPDVSTPPARMRPWDRGAAAAAAGFTSTAAANHLLTFGDFAAMYLLAWNPDLWPRAGRWPSPFEQYQGIDPARRPRPMAEYLLRLRDEVPKLEAARRGTAAARRVLANVPTYMIFDDHEITDDWYLNGKWKRDVLGNPTGRRAIANGLAAYWAFQGWGNEPGQFDLNRFVAPIVTHLASGTDAHAGGYENTVIDFHDWGFVAPTRPGTVFLNTRTRRDPNGASFDVRFQEVRLPPAGVPAGVAPIPIPRTGDPSRLLGADERVVAGRRFAAARGRDEPLIVVAPAPVFGWQTLELIQRLIGAGSPAAADLESWAANPPGFADILELILAARPPLAVLLGGDVHYAFAAAARVTDAGSSVPVAQFTSSATKNETRGVMGLLQAVLGLRSAYEYGGPDVRCWWVPAGDGPVSTYALDSLTAPLALPIVRILADGRESFREQAKLTSLADGGFPADVLLRQVIQATSNVGELRLDGTTLRHRFWVQDGANTRSMPMQEWAAANWPVPPTSIS